MKVDVNVASVETLIVGVVARSSSAGAATRSREEVARAVEAAGASVELWTEATAIAKGVAVDAIVFDLGAAPEELLPIVLALEGEPRTSAVPRVVIVDEDVPASRLALFGDVAIVGTNAPAEAFAGAIARALSLAKARNELQRSVHTNSAAVRELEQILATFQRDGATLGHDGRVLLGVILGIAANLRDGLVGPITAEQRQHLVNVVAASEDASNLLAEHAAALRRASARGVTTAPAARTPTRRHVDLGELTRSTTALFDGAAGAKRIRLVVDVERACYAWCDPVQMKQALVNLVNNALKFTPAGGTVCVSARFGPPQSARGGATDRRDVEIEVSDSGPGIPADQRERVFERGARLERDRAVPGTGQGLAIVRDVVALHGGSVRLDEAAEGGASFVLLVPTDRRSRGGDEAPPSSRSRRLEPQGEPR